MCKKCPKECPGEVDRELAVEMRVFLFVPFFIPVRSMSPALIAGDFIFVSKMIPEPKRLQVFVKSGYRIFKPKFTKNWKIP
jgi:signal peptidase I